MNFDEVIQRLSAARGNPEALTLATLDLILASADSDVRPAFEAAAIPHWFDAEILSKMLQLQVPTAASVLEKLRRLPMVEPFSTRSGWNVHEATRLAYRAQFARERPERFRSLSEKAVQCFKGDEPHFVIEKMFHRLVCEPKPAAEDLYRLWVRWDRTGRHQRLQALGLMLRELLLLPTIEDLPRGFASICLGWIMQDHLPKPEIEKLARHGLALVKRQGHVAGEVEARSLLGQTLQSRGTLDGARREFEAALKLMIRLTERAPENVELQRELFAAHVCYGNVLRSQGDSEGALREYQRAKDIMRNLTMRDPQNADWQRDLSIAYSYVGGIARTRKQWEEALREYAASKEIDLELTRRDPENSDWQFGLAIAHGCLGAVLEAQNKLEEALKEYQHEMRIIEALTRRDPENAGWQSQLSNTHNAIGNVLLLLDRLDESFREFQESKQILHELTERDPENSELQRDLAIAHNCVGNILERKGELRLAAEQHGKSLDIVSKLASLDPTNSLWKADLANSQKNVERVAELQAGESKGQAQN